MADPVLKSPTNFVDLLQLICRMDTTDHNDSLKDSVIEALDVQRALISANQEFFPSVKEKLAHKPVDSLTRRRDQLGSYNQENVAFASSYIKRSMDVFEQKGLKENLAALKLSEMSYTDARSAIYNSIANISPMAASEFFTGAKGREEFDEQKNAAMINIIESAVQITYANTVIQEAKEQSKGLAQANEKGLTLVTGDGKLQTNLAGTTAQLTEEQQKEALTAKKAVAGTRP